MEELLEEIEKSYQKNLLEFKTLDEEYDILKQEFENGKNVNFSDIEYRYNVCYEKLKKIYDKLNYYKNKSGK